MVHERGFGSEGDRGQVLRRVLFLLGSSLALLFEVVFFDFLEHPREVLHLVQVDLMWLIFLCIDFILELFLCVDVVAKLGGLGVESALKGNCNCLLSVLLLLVNLRELFLAIKCLRFSDSYK